VEQVPAEARLSRFPEFNTLDRMVAPTAWLTDKGTIRILNLTDTGTQITALAKNAISVAKAVANPSADIAADTESMGSASRLAAEHSVSDLASSKI
jgi:hypothetical protein